MIEKLTSIEKLDRTELYNAIYSLYEMSNNVKVFRCNQDYSGNYDELYNAYATLNTKECEQGLADYFMDNVLLDTKKDVEHLYYVKMPVSTYLKYEALKVLVNAELGQKSYVCDNAETEDFIVFDGAVVVLDVTKQGAVIGGSISTNPTDVDFALKLFNILKSDASDYLKTIKPEANMANSIKRKIKELKQNLNIK